MTEKKKEKNKVRATQNHPVSQKSLDAVKWHEKLAKFDGQLIGTPDLLVMQYLCGGQNAKNVDICSYMLESYAYPFIFIDKKSEF